MVKIISTVPHHSVVKQCVCRNCGATLEYTPNDVKSKSHTDYTGCTDTDYYIVCPNCSKPRYVKNTGY